MDMDFGAKAGDIVVSVNGILTGYAPEKSSLPPPL